MLTTEQKNALSTAFAEGKTVKDAASTAGVSYSSARNYGLRTAAIQMRKEIAPPTQEEAEKLQELFSMDIGVQTAAKIVGVCRATAERYAKETGYSGGKRGMRPKDHPMALQRPVFSVYSFTRKTLIVKGTAEKCAKSLGITLNSFYAAHSRYKNGTRKTWIIERIA